MIGADKPFGVAASVATEDYTAVGTAVGEHIHTAVAIARHHHRLVADIGADEIVRVGYLGFEGHIRPVRTAENALLLAVVYILITVNPGRNAGGSPHRPRSPMQPCQRVHGIAPESVRHGFRLPVHGASGKANEVSRFDDRSDLASAAMAQATSEEPHQP